MNSIFVEIQNCMNRIDFNCSAELLKSESKGLWKKKARNPESDHTFFQTVRRTENILSESVEKNRVEAALLLKLQRPRWQYTGSGQISKIPPKIQTFFFVKSTGVILCIACKLNLKFVKLTGVISSGFQRKATKFDLTFFSKPEI